LFHCLAPTANLLPDPVPLSFLGDLRSAGHAQGWLCEPR
jgi:hypothetical protein